MISTSSSEENYTRRRKTRSCSLSNWTSYRSRARFLVWRSLWRTPRMLKICSSPATKHISTLRLICLRFHSIIRLDLFKCLCLFRYTTKITTPDLPFFHRTLRMTSSRKSRVLTFLFLAKWSATKGLKSTSEIINKNWNFSTLTICSFATGRYTTCLENHWESCSMKRKGISIDI